jgi:hypothetical protein
MAGLKTLLGLYPKTNDYEQYRKQLAEEYNALNEYETSDELARFKELELYLKSDEFLSEKRELLNLRYKDSDEYRKEQEFNQLSKDSELKLYFKTVGSDNLKLYERMNDSEKLEKYKSLQEYIKSDEFHSTKRFFSQSGKKRFEQSDFGKKLADYTIQNKSTRIKGYKKFVDNKLYKDFKSIEGSEKLGRYQELVTITNSFAFKEKQKSLKKADFLATEEGKQFNEYQFLKSANDIKNYIKHANSPLKRYYDELYDSNEIVSFFELEKYINSPEFKQQKLAIERKTFKDTEEYQKQAEYDQMSRDPEIKTYFKFAQSKDLLNYNTINTSNKLAHYEELKDYLQGDAFIEKKKFLTMSPKLRWKQSEPYTRQVEYETLSKSEKIVWYLKFKGHKKFDWLRTWQLSFDDDFDTGKLNKKKWITRYYWGNELLHDSYSLSHEKHFISDGENLEFTNNSLRIITRKESATGKIWHDEYGFCPQEFDYTSGLINSGKSFWQKYGWFEAKIRFSNNPDVLNAFWMVGNQKLPHIDVAKADSKVTMGLQAENGTSQKKSLGLRRYVEDFHIFSIEWSPEKITWRINGLEATTAKLEIPNEEMYLAFSSSLYKDFVQGLPSTFEIDWVKCYKRAE